MRANTLSILEGGNRRDPACLHARTFINSVQPRVGQ